MAPEGGTQYPYTLIESTENMARTQVMPPTAGDFDALYAMEPAEYAAKEKRLVWKIDFRLMPCLILMIVLKYTACSSASWGVDK